MIKLEKEKFKSNILKRKGKKLLNDIVTFSTIKENQLEELDDFTISNTIIILRKKIRKEFGL